MSTPENLKADVGPVLESARAYAQAGLSVIPILPCAQCSDPLKGKQSAVDWKLYQSEYPLADQLDDWFGTGTKGIAIVTGNISGGLEILDFEVVDTFEQWRQIVQAQAPGLLERLSVVATPRPGRHVYFRSSCPAASQKLARTVEGKTLIESKGEGGYVLSPGSPAECHPAGTTYEHLAGPPLTAIPTISAEERACLFDAARLFDAKPKPARKDDQEGKASSHPATSECQMPPRERAEAYLKKCEPAVSGQGTASDHCFKLACALVHGFGLSDEEALAAFNAGWNDRCLNGDTGQPYPWSDNELLHKIHDARLKGHWKNMLNESSNSTNHTHNGHTAPAPDVSVPKPSQEEGTIWKPVPISQLKRLASLDSWVWQGIFAPGKITLMAAEAKAGKTTLLSLLYQRMAKGGTLCGSKVHPGRVVVVSEEPSDIWLDRRELLSLGDHVEILPVPFINKPSRHDWEKMLRCAFKALKEKPAALITFDTLSHLWWLEDENDNAKEAAALQPLRQLCQTGAALGLIHHFGAEKNGPRGGTEIRGFPDILAELHLVKPHDLTNRCRLLKVRGRLIQPCQTVIELNNEGNDYKVIEGALPTGSPNLWTVLCSLVGSQPPGRSARQFQNAWPTKPPPEAKRINEALAKNWQMAGWQRTGTGVKNDPFRYWRPNPELN